MEFLEKLWSLWGPVIGSWGLRVLIALLIFVIGKWIAGFLIKRLLQVMERAHVDQTLAKFLTNIASAVLMIAVLIAAIDQMGIPITSFLAILGAAGLAIGLALHGSLSNFSSGVMLILFRPFKVGDFVDAGGVSGTIESIQIFNTMLKTPDNRQITVPNSQIFDGPITNYSAKSTRRIDLVIGISYDDDIGKAFQIIKSVVEADDRVLKDPEVTIMVLELADSSVNIAVRPWVNRSDYGPARGDLLHNLKVELGQAGLSIPYPQQDVHMHQAA